VPVIIAGTLNTFAKLPVDVTLKSHFNVTYCQSNIPKTEVLVTIGLGDVKRVDSLYGFNFAIKYDRSKLYFNSKITVNTLSEFAEYADVSFGLEPGKMFGAALNNTPMSGNKELIGFFGEYIGDLCNDSAFVEIEYIEFTDEFQKQVNKLDTIWIKPNRVELNYNIGVNLPDSNYIYDKQGINLIPVELNMSNVKYLDYIGFEITSKQDNSYDEIYNLQYRNLNPNLSVYKYEGTPSKYNIILKVENFSKLQSDNKIFDLEIEKMKNMNLTDTMTKVFVTPIKLSDCSCFDYTKVTEDNIPIRYISDNTSVVDIFETVELKYTDGLLSLNANDNIINRIQLFNSVGVLIADENVYGNKYTKHLDLANGVYYSLLWTNKQIITKKFSNIIN